jgi:hypothetical protein
MGLNELRRHNIRRVGSMACWCRRQRVTRHEGHEGYVQKY